MSEKYHIGINEYPILEYSRHPSTGLLSVPLLDIPMMTDYKSQRIALESRIKHPEHYCETEDVEKTIRELIRWLAYNEPHRIEVMIKESPKRLQAHAEAHGESVNAFINRAIDETMERDSGATAATEEATE